MTEGNDQLFVGIRDPTDIRKGMLESSKSMIECLKRYEKLRLVRQDKEKEVHRLKSILNEIDSLLVKLKNSLPLKTGLKPLTELDEEEMIRKEQEELDKIEEVRLKSIKNEKVREEDYIDDEIEALRRETLKNRSRQTHVRPEKKPTKKESKKTVKKVNPKHISELAKLEDELKNIEEKLGRL